MKIDLSGKPGLHFAMQVSVARAVAYDELDKNGILTWVKDDRLIKRDMYQKAYKEFMKQPKSWRKQLMRIGGVKEKDIK